MYNLDFERFFKGLTVYGGLFVVGFLVGFFVL